MTKKLIEVQVNALNAETSKEIDEYLCANVGRSGKDWWWTGWPHISIRLYAGASATAFVLRYGIAPVEDVPAESYNHKATTEILQRGFM